MSDPIERPCPKCGADAGQSCLGKRGAERKAYHRARGYRVRAAHAPYARPQQVTESPIEEQLVSAIMGWLDHYGISDVGVHTQAKVGPFRADILIQDDCRFLAVECDGHRFHTSPEQVARDKRRDRYFASKGLSVMRFTGTEITRDPRRCAAEIGVWILRP